MVVVVVVAMMVVLWCCSSSCVDGALCYFLRGPLTQTGHRRLARLKMSCVSSACAFSRCPHAGQTAAEQMQLKKTWSTLAAPLASLSRQYGSSVLNARAHTRESKNAPTTPRIGSCRIGLDSLTNLSVRVRLPLPPRAPCKESGLVLCLLTCRYQTRAVLCCFRQHHHDANFHVLSYAGSKPKQREISYGCC